jgi:alpha-beta hydrolase superfamily lysophospholipase
MQVLRVIAQSMPIIGHEKLYARLWSRGDGRERGVVILVHGLGDHGGRFEAFAKRLIKRRWAVFAVDLPGHGRSSGRRGTVKSFDSVLRVVASARQTVFERLGDCEQILLGHSMGGNFAVNYALRRAEFDACSMPGLSGLILVAPMLMPPESFDRSRIFAAWGTGQLLRWVRISKPARLGQLTRDSAVADRIQTDPLQHSQISLYLATQLLAQGRFAIDRAGENVTPTLVLHGDEDQLIDHAACRNLALRMRGAADFVRWTGGRHDLVNDIDADQVADLLSEWMNGKAVGIRLGAA